VIRRGTCSLGAFRLEDHPSRKPPLRYPPPSPARPNDVPISLFSLARSRSFGFGKWGKHNDEIAAELVISSFTMRNHVLKLLRKARAPRTGHRPLLTSSGRALAGCRVP
jgi:hypothetical protein